MDETLHDKVYLDNLKWLSNNISRFSNESLWTPLPKFLPEQNNLILWKNWIYSVLARQEEKHLKFSAIMTTTVLDQVR